MSIKMESMLREPVKLTAKLIFSRATENGLLKFQKVVDLKKGNTLKQFS